MYFWKLSYTVICYIKLYLGTHMTGSLWRFFLTPWFASTIFPVLVFILLSLDSGILQIVCQSFVPIIHHEQLEQQIFGKISQQVWHKRKTFVSRYAPGSKMLNFWTKFLLILMFVFIHGMLLLAANLAERILIRFSFKTEVLFCHQICCLLDDVLETIHRTWQNHGKTSDSEHLMSLLQVYVRL